jgi:hypothetical protein
MEVFLLRDKQVDDQEGQFGKFTIPGLFECYSAELPYRPDGQGKRLATKSRIAPGEYEAIWTPSASRKNKDGSPETTYLLKNVPDAKGIRIHVGNFAGNIDLGFVSDVEGCIVLGRAIMMLGISESKQARAGVTRTSQMGVSSSADTIREFHALTAGRPLKLIIEEQ